MLAKPKKRKNNKQTKKEKQSIYDNAMEIQKCCILCGSGYQLVRHHIRHFGTRLTFDGNIAILCTNCHINVHKDTKRFTQILIDIINELHNLDLPLYIKYNISDQDT
jgi:5-methylcytosine-specific restriction endonuclease McrA